jgi:fucose permease
MFDMSRKKNRKKKKTAQPKNVPPRKNTKYSAGEIAMAILGGALIILFGGIIATSCLG